MQVRYPKSFFKLLAVAFFLAVLPLAVGLLANMLAVQKLADQSQKAVYSAARIAHGSRQLSEMSPALERAARQSLLLRDASMRAAYSQLRDDFNTAVSDMQRLPLDAEMQALLARMLEESAQIDELMRARVPSDKLLAKHFAALGEAGEKMLAHSAAVIDRETEDLRRHAQDAEGSARIQLLVVLPVALLVVAGFTYLLAKPIAQLEAGIRGLGEQRLNQPVVVEGPEDLVQLGEQLDWLRLRLVHLEAQKARFLRHVSHELKTPLTALREGSELLAEGTTGPLLPRQQEILSIVRENSVQLQRLIESLLRHGEEEFFANHLQRQSLSLRPLVATVCSRQKISAEARGIRFTQHVENTDVTSDLERLRVILDNLVSNAIKHSPQNGEVIVSGSVEGNLLRLRVLDEGPGVPADEREKIFEPFYRGIVPASGRIKSTGLGLSICSEHVQALGGRIEVGEGRGDFRVLIPLNTEIAQT